MNELDRTGGWSYAPAPEGTDHIQLQPSYGLFIDGSFSPSESGGSFATINPATEEKLAEVALASDLDIDRAVGAARRAYNSTWSKMAPKERGKYLFRVARILQERARELAVIETLDGGKPIRESKSVDIPLAAAHFFYYAGWADKLDYAFPGRSAAPLGVAAQVIPWNFPLLMAAWKLAPALACGNTVVLKPAETTPLTALKLAEIIRDAGIPDGVVNIVTGAGAAGAALVRHPDVDKVAFTGSTEVGREIQRSVAGTGKRYTLELGGKAANIIFEDAAIDQAIEGIVNGIFFNQGHVCCAGSRLLVQESVALEVVAKLKDRMQTLQVGDPLDKNTDIGAINSRAQLDTIHSYLEIGREQGAQVFQPSCELPASGFWCAPTLFEGVSQSSRVVQEEIFGPVLAIQTFRTVDEAIKKANNTPYGLSGGVWSDKGSKAFRVTNKIRAGVLWANTYNKFDPTSPFGGYKESGMGREGGLHGLSAYCDLVSTRAPIRSETRSPGQPKNDLLDPQHAPDREGAQLTQRLGVRKTYKLFVGGQFPRTESGRYHALELPGGEIVNVSRASRKDVRDAVVAARGAQSAWASRSAYNRAQILYRIAEMLEGRRSQFEMELAATLELAEPEADAKEQSRTEVDQAIDALVYWAGWADKVQQVFSAVNPVASSHFNFSMIEPTGVVTAVAPRTRGLLGLVQTLAPAVVTGNTVVALASEAHPLCAITLGEVLQTSDLPAGVINLLTGERDELTGWLASHRDVGAIIYCGQPGEQFEQVQLEATHNLKRVVLRADPVSAQPDPYWMLDTCEVKTTWHPVGS